MKHAFFYALILSPILTFGTPRPLPHPEPYLGGEKAERHNVEFKVETFTHTPHKQKPSILERPFFAAGNKAVVVRADNQAGNDKNIQVQINGKTVAVFAWWGSAPNWGWGYPFPNLKDKPDSLEIDRKTESVTYRKPFRLPDGTECVFTYTLRKGKKPGTVELSWDSGIPDQPEYKKILREFQFWILLNRLSPDAKISFGGKEFKRSAREELLARKKEQRIGVSGDFELGYLNAPDNGFSVLHAGKNGNYAENLQIAPKTKEEKYSGTYRRYSPMLSKETIVIDLENTIASVRKAPPRVGGIDFWKDDRLHVPVPPTGNVFVNPNFDQGLRGWFWTDGGAIYDPNAPQNKYEIVPDGYVGKNALRMNTFQRQSSPLKSFPYALENGQTYTLSFYAKAEKPTSLTVALSSVSQAGKFVGLKYGNFFGDTHKPEAKFRLTTEWKRYSRTFVADNGGVHLQISGYSAPVLLDAFQLEKSAAPTEFVCSPLTGNLTTSHPDNQPEKGKAIDAKMNFSGKDGIKGKVKLSVSDAYHETLFEKEYDIEAGKTLPLPLTPELLDEGIFSVRADFSVKGFPEYTEYYRLSVMKALKGTHATKNLFGTLGEYARISRGDDLAKKYMEWGFGASSHHVPAGSVNAMLQKKYNITNYVFSGIAGAKGIGNPAEWKEVTPELEKKIEEASFENAKKADPATAFSWSLYNEEESGYLPAAKRFDEYFKAQHAMARGVLRANPNAIITPTNGTSGYSILRGYDAIGGYLAAAKKAGFKYGAVSVHPYWSVDGSSLGPNDLDEEAARLVNQMKRYGYGKETPIYFTELYNIPWVRIPAWGAELWADSYRCGGSPTYNIGNREFIHAANAARIFLITLKYWPQVQMNNLWVARPVMDLYLTPILFCKAANTLGNLLPDTAFYADARPARGIRGYVYKLKDGSAVAAVWCIDHDVENGLKRGPVMDVKFGQNVKFFDLMGAERSASPDTNGITRIPLTPAPLFLKAKDASMLAKALQNAVSDDAASALNVAMQPELNGNIVANVKNLTGREQSGSLDGVPYRLNPMEEKKIVLPNANQGHVSGRMFRWNRELQLTPDKGAGQKIDWKMDYFYVPVCASTPDWSKVPSIAITNRHGKKPDTLAASYQLTWNNEKLFLRVTAKDPDFELNPNAWKVGGAERNLYNHDGCLEVYFDCGANGRTNLVKTYDKDDYRYDFSIGKSGKSGPGMVRRFREVNWQFAGGTAMPTKEDAAKGIKCDFQRTSDGYVYTIEFPRRYIEPIRLEPGFTAGFGLYLHDHANKNKDWSGLSLASEPGKHCDYNPQLWPLMIFAE